MIWQSRTCSYIEARSYCTVPRSPCVSAIERSESVASFSKILRSWLSSVLRCSAEASSFLRETSSLFSFTMASFVLDFFSRSDSVERICPISRSTTAADDS